MINISRGALRRCLIAAALVSVASCGPRDPTTPDEKSARRDELLRKMSDTLKNAQAFSFTVNESHERVRKTGQKGPYSLKRDLLVRRPDRLWAHTTGTASDDRDVNTTYDGKTVTIVGGNQKIYATFKAADERQQEWSNTMRVNRRLLGTGAAVLTAVALIGPIVEAQRAVRSARHGTVAKGEEATVAVGRRGVAVAGEEKAGAVSRRGAVAVGDDGAAAVSRRGAVVVGEEGAAAVGRYGGVVVGEHYESHEAWRTAAGVATGIAIGTMLARPQAASTTVVVSGTSYMYSDGAYYARVMSGGSVAYQVVPAPAGAIIATLPADARRCAWAASPTLNAARRTISASRTAIRWWSCAEAERASSVDKT